MNLTLLLGFRQDRNYSMDQLHREREDKFQSDLLKLYAENAELRFEIEQNKIDIPRQKVCMHSILFCVIK